MIVLGIPEGRLHAAPTLVTLGRGYFQSQGIQVQAVNAGSHFRGVPMLASGELDVMPVGPLLGFFEAWDPSEPMILVADQGSVRDGRGEAAIVGRPSLMRTGALRDYADLRGKRVGLSSVRGDHDWLTFAAALARGGLTFADVEIVICPFGDERHAALAQGDIDVATVNRLGSLRRGRETGAFEVWKHEHEFRQRQERAICFSYRFWSNHPDDAHRFVVAYLRGLRDYYNAFERGVERDDVVKLLAQKAGEPQEAVGREMVPMAVDPNGYLNVPAIAADIDWLRREGVLSHPVSVDQLVNYDYLNAALASLGKYEEPSPSTW